MPLSSLVSYRPFGLKGVAFPDARKEGGGACSLTTDGWSCARTIDRMVGRVAVTQSDQV